MSEDFDAKLYKNDWHKNKHTLRYYSNNYRYCKNYKLECDRVIKKDEIPVTSINSVRRKNGNAFYQ